MHVFTLGKIFANSDIFEIYFCLIIIIGQPSQTRVFSGSFQSLKLSALFIDVERFLKK